MAGKRRYIKGPDGKMKGSSPLPVEPPPTDNPWDPVPVDLGQNDQEPSYADLFNMYVTKPPAAQLDPETYPHDFLMSDHPTAHEVNEAFSALAPEQRVAAITDQLQSVESGVRRTPGQILQGPADAEEWQTWCRLQAERLADSNPSLARSYLRLGQSSPPTVFEFAYLLRARAHANATAQSYDREMRYLAGYLGKDTDSVRIRVEAQRLAYLRLPEDERPITPAWFESGIESSYWGKDRFRKPPMDKATLWGLYSTMSDASVTDSLPAHESTEYVVFDTETTGLSDSAAIVQITAIRYDADGIEQERISTYLRPDDPAVFDGPDAQKAAEVTGITYDRVKDSPTFADIAPDLHTMMSGRTLVAHNLMFDYPRVQRAFAASGDQSLSPSERVLPLGPIVDTLRLARWVQPNPGVARKEWKHTLEHACKRAGITFDTEEAHDALYDVERTNDLFKYLRSAPLGG